jgi:hypothetical protein
MAGKPKSMSMAVMCKRVQTMSNSIVHGSVWRKGGICAVQDRYCAMYRPTPHLVVALCKHDGRVACDGLDTGSLVALTSFVSLNRRTHRSKLQKSRILTIPSSGVYGIGSA